MSDVSDTNIVIENGTKEDLPDELEALIAAQRAEIEAAGVEVTRIVVEDLDVPPRFHILFKKGEPSSTARMRLEEKRYDVGQNLGEKNLSFYVTKRVEQTKGWSV
jgi:hypothetical protein